MLHSGFLELVGRGVFVFSYCRPGRHIEEAFRTESLIYIRFEQELKQTGFTRKMSSRIQHNTYSYFSVCACFYCDSLKAFGRRILGLKPHPGTGPLVFLRPAAEVSL